MQYCLLEMNSGQQDFMVFLLSRWMVLTVFGLSKRIKNWQWPEDLRIEGLVRTGFLLKAILCFLLAPCQALPGTLAHLVVTTPLWGNWFLSSFYRWANSDSKVLVFPRLCGLQVTALGVDPFPILLTPGPLLLFLVPWIERWSGGWASALEAQALASRWNWLPELSTLLRVQLVGVVLILFYVVGFCFSSLFDVL